MSIHLEFEAKSMLTKSEYLFIANEFSNTQKYIQSNYYISTLKMPKNIGMRIRYKNHKFELTIKVDQVNFKKEINQKIPMISFIFLRIFGIFPKGEVYKYLVENTNINIRNLRIIGKMKTYRTDINFEGSLISLDESKYNGKTDYEIECEASNYAEAESKLIKFLHIREIIYKKSKYSKLARFMETK